MKNVVVDFGAMLEKIEMIPELVEELRRLREAVDGGSPKAEYLDYSEASGYLKIGVTTLQQLVCAKGVPHYKLGSRVLFVRTELDEWMREKRIEALSKRLGKRKEAMKERDGPRPDAREASL